MTKYIIFGALALVLLALFAPHYFGSLKTFVKGLIAKLRGSKTALTIPSFRDLIEEVTVRQIKATGDPTGEEAARAFEVTSRFWAAAGLTPEQQATKTLGDFHGSLTDKLLWYTLPETEVKSES